MDPVERLSPNERTLLWQLVVGDRDCWLLVKPSAQLLRLVEEDYVEAAEPHRARLTTLGWHLALEMAADPQTENEAYSILRSVRIVREDTGRYRAVLCCNREPVRVASNARTSMEEAVDEGARLWPGLRIDRCLPW